MIAPYPTDRETARETKWALRRLRLAVDAIRRRWGPGSERRVATMLRTVAEQVEGSNR